MKYNFAILIVFFTNIANSQLIVINEVMASNTFTLADEDGDYSDWIELYNVSKNKVDLSQYWLTDDKDVPKKWRLPNLQLDQNAHLLIFCSGKDKILGELHTNFKINIEGETVRLYDELGIEVDKILSLDVPMNYSFGSIKDGAEDRVVFAVPTPGFQNVMSTTNFNGIRFSKKGGIYSNVIEVVLDGDDSTNIFYTLDGDIPTELDFKYTEKLKLDKTLFSHKDISSIVMSPADIHHPPVDILPQAIVLRAAKFYNGERISPVATQTYVIKEITSPFVELPIVSISTDSGSLFNKDTGIFVPGVYYDNSLPDFSGNYFQSGPTWERLINVEYFSPYSDDCFNQECGLRLHGNGSRKSPQKALRIYAREEYGKSSFDAKVLSEKPFTSFKRLVLKPYYSSWSQNGCEDYLAGRMAKSLNMEYLAADPIILFVNGEYWGLYYLQERIDEKYLEQNIGIEGDSIDIIESWYGVVDEGNNKNFNALYDFIEQNDLKDPTNYKLVASWMDIDNFIDYQIFQAYVANYDWPANNMRCWRERKEGAKWRWIFFDADGGLENVTFNGLRHSTDINGNGWPSSPRSTLFLRKLLENESFSGNYTRRLRQLLKDELHITRTQSLVDDLDLLIINEIYNQSRRFGKPTTIDARVQSMANLNHFIGVRACQLAAHAEEMFEEKFFINGCSLSADIKTQLFVMPNPTKGSCQIVFNSIDIGVANIEVVSMTGQKLYSEIAIINNNINTINLHLEAMTKGLYFIRVATEKQIFSEKIMLR